jgi:predicted transcriptional regulator
MGNEDTNALLKELLQELVQIKRLLAFRLIQDDYTQSEIADALGVSQPTISRYFPAKVSRPAKKTPG